MKRVHLFKTSLSGVKDIPDPLNIYTLNQWYILDSVAENLVRFNHSAGNYEPVIAQSWSIDNEQLRFQIREGLKFHDGTPLTAKDVLATFRRIIRLKTSTHYQLWKFLKNCDRPDCPALRIENGNELVVDFTGDSAAFFMFLSSPEGSIWAKEDMARDEFKPAKYSGFYFAERITDKIELSVNPNSPRRPFFPSAPEKVHVYNIQRTESIDAVKDGHLDAVILDYTPFSTQLAQAKGLQVTKTIPITFVHLMKLGGTKDTPFNMDFLREIWTGGDGSGLLVPAHGLLPPGVEGRLSAEQAEKAYEKAGAGSGRSMVIGYLPTYHSEEFVAAIGKACVKAGISARFQKLTREEFYQAAGEPKASKMDYLLVGYIASDKFPLTQLKLMLWAYDIPYDLDRSEASTQEAIDHLTKIQQHVLREQIMIPLYFAPMLNIAGADIDLGNQPETDAELQYWRINENTSAGQP